MDVNKPPAASVNIAPLFDKGLDGIKLGAVSQATASWRQVRAADDFVVDQWSAQAKAEGLKISELSDASKIATERGGMRAFNAMVAQGDFEGALSFSDQMSLRIPAFGAAPMMMEKRIVCMNKSKPPLTDQALSEALRLVQATPQSGEAHGALGKAWLTKSKAYKAAGDDAAAQQALVSSKDAYLAGFESSGEFYPGINAAYRLVDLGAVEQARALAKWVCLSAEASADNHDFWSTASAMEASVLAGDDVGLSRSLARLRAHKDEPGWMAEATLQSLGALDAQLFPLAAKATQTILSGFEGVEPEAAQHPLLSKTFSYRGMGGDFAGGAAVEGNMRFGGQLAAHSVTRWDRKVFRDILGTPLVDFLPEAAAHQAAALVGSPTLGGALDPDAMNQALNVVVRTLFDTSGQSVRDEMIKKPGPSSEGLERLDSVEHLVFDEAVSSLNKVFMGESGREADSRTSVALSLAVGLGDCRHHAQTKQLMFDLWQEQLLARLARDGSRAGVAGDEPRSEAYARDYQKLAGVRMRTADVEIWAAIAGEKMYQVERTPDGRRIAGEVERKVEEHTLNVLVKTDPSMKVLSAALADGFYKKEYDLSSKSISVAGSDFQATAPSVELVGVDGPVQAPVRLTAVAYAGKRDARSSDETGAGGLLLGADVGAFDVIGALAKRAKPLSNRLCVAGLARAVPELLGTHLAPTLSGLSAGGGHEVEDTSLNDIHFSKSLVHKLHKMRLKQDSSSSAPQCTKLGV